MTDAAMQAFLAGLGRVLVTTPDAVTVDVADGPRATRFLIHAPVAERGQLIGKEGATIRAVRQLVALVGDRHNRRYEVEVPD